MGCTSSVHLLGRKERSSIPELTVFTPSIRFPVHSDLQRAVKGLIPRDLSLTLSSLRNQIVLLAKATDGSATSELREALEEYLSVLIGLTKKEYGLVEVAEFKWKNMENKRQEICVANSWFEVLSVINMMAVITLSEADTLVTPKNQGDSKGRAVSADRKRDAVDLLLRAAGYLQFCVHSVLPEIPSDIKKKLPKDLQQGALEAISSQVLGQGTEIQLGLAVESQKATLSVKRRLACEQLTYYSQAHHFLVGCDFNHRYGKKHLLFIKWKYLEAKAAAYYYHGMIVDKGTEPSCHVSAVSCFLAAEELLSASKKACLGFCLADPVNRIPPLWGVMKYLNQRIPEIASRKSEMYSNLLEDDKALHEPPDLPEFQLSLRPDDYELPELHPTWDTGNWELPSQTLKELLSDGEEDS